ncbi:MAG: putative metal-binding motif-containing protein, partial [Sandaracinaceae bacterium]|nr:putative metal-binding motif-containing protein [Sandaracinaceae bacterium]
MRVPFVGLLALGVWAGCTSPPPPSELELLPSARDVLTPAIEPLDTNMDGTTDRYQAAFPPVLLEGGRVLSRTIAYEELAGQYRGALSLRFEPAWLTPQAYTHVETIPKAFASDASELTYGFSATVLEADPVLEIELAEGEAPNLELVCETLVADAPAALDAAQQVSAEYASYECNGLSGQAATDCWLAAILRYPSTAAVQDYLTRCAAGDSACAAAHALASGDWATHCDGLPRERDTRRCYYEIFNTYADQDCGQRPDPAEVAACLHAQWERIGNDEVRNQLCFNNVLLEGVSPAMSWLGFMELCLGDRALDTCDTLASSDLRAQCVASIARVSGDIAVCDTLAGDERTYCRAQYLYELADDPADCEPFRADQAVYDACHRGLAVGLGDPVLCLAIADPETRNLCLAELVADVPADPAVCEGVLPVPDDEHADAYRRTAHDICVLLALAHPGSNIANCDRIEDREMRAWCRLGMAIRDDALGTTCTAFESPVLACVCLAGTGAARKDRAACERIALDAARAACVTAVLRNDPSAMHDAITACLGQCVDRDGDGAYAPQGCVNYDCDDENRSVFPEAPEDCGNDADDDCD